MSEGDITERLRWCRWRNRETGEYADAYDTAGVESERLEAADTIDSQQAEIERLRKEIDIRKSAQDRYAPCGGHAGKNPSGGCLMCEIERLRGELAWVGDVADRNYEQDEKLQSQGARTLARISARVRAALAEGGE